MKDMTVSIAVQKLGLEWSDCLAKLNECDSARPIPQRKNIAVENVDTWPAVEWKPKNIGTIIRHPIPHYIPRGQCISQIFGIKRKAGRR